MEIEIQNLTRQIEDGLVIKIVYRFKKTVDEHTVATRFSEIKLSGDSNANDFIPYETLTKTIVDSWITDRLTAEKLAEIEDLLDQKMIDQTTPTTANGLPWSE